MEKAEPIGELASEEDVARDGLLDAERTVLKHRLDSGVARARGVPVRLALAAHKDFAAGRLNCSRQHFYERRFACAVVAEQAHDLAAIDVKVHAADCEYPAVALCDILEFDQPLGHRRLFHDEEAGAPPCRRRAGRLYRKPWVARSATAL